MKILEIEETKKTPYVKLDADLGYIELKGKSIPENTLEFYKPLILWMQSYIENPHKNTVVTCKLEYINSGSYKCIFEMLNKLKHLKSSDTHIEINWHYDWDDEDMASTIEVFESLLNIPINIVLLD